MNNIKYIGNGAYCYANSAAMLLSSIGENISPSIIEVLSGIGLSAFWMKNENLLFPNFALPNEELSHVFETLGFEIIERQIPKKEPFPKKQIAKDLKMSPILIGPIDMGYLVYNPNHHFLYGSDHYVLLYGFNKEGVYLHDPERYPCVFLSWDNLEKSWKSNKILYGIENYQYWTLPRRIYSPSYNEIYSRAIKDFQSIYKNCEKKSVKNNWITGSSALVACGKHFQNGKFEISSFEQLVYFTFTVGAKRALDFSNFFLERNKILSDLKRKQAESYGAAQSQAGNRKWKQLATTLINLAKTEAMFEEKLMNINS